MNSKRLSFLSWLVLLALGGSAWAQTADRAQQDRIIRALSDASFKVRLEAAILVGKHRVERAAPTLLTTLSDPHETVRAAAAVSLARLGNQEHRKNLIALLKDPKKMVAQAAEQALILLDQDRGEPRIFLVVDQLAPSSAKTTAELGSWVIDKVREYLKANLSVLVSAGEEKLLSKAELAQHLKRRKLSGFNIQTKIAKLTHQKRSRSTQTHCELNALVFTLTGNRVEFVASGEADAEIDRTSMSSAEREALEQAVLDAAAKASADKAVEFLKDRAEP